MNGHINGSVSLKSFPPLDTLFALYGMFDGVLSHAFKSGDLPDLVLIRPGAELNSYHS